MLWGPTAGLSFFLGRAAAPPGPWESLDPFSSLRARAGGPGDHRGGVQVQPGDATAFGVFGVSLPDAAEFQGATPTDWTENVASSKLGCSVGHRKSPRLASRPGVHALTLAMTRKAAQRDDPPRAASGLGGWADPARCGSASATASRGGQCTSTPPSVNRIVFELSANCGVMLSEAEAASLTCFLQAAAAKV